MSEAPTRKPAVSICMPSFNQARFLPQTLDSALAQTFQDFEVALVDDGSTDATLTIARSYESRHPGRLRVYTHPGGANRGISASTNLAISRTTGEFIVILDSDDLWLPDTLDRRYAFMRANPDAALACTHYDMIDENNQCIGRHRPESDISEICQSRPGFLHSMIMGCAIGNPTVMVRRTCLEALEPFDEQLLHGDWEIWTRLAALFTVRFLPQVTALHRRHTTNVTGSHSMVTELERRLAVMLALERKAPTVGGAMALPVIRGLIHLEICCYQFCLYRRPEALRHLQLALRCNPGMLDNGGAYFQTWLTRRPPIAEPRADFHAWIKALLTRHAAPQTDK